MIRPSTVPKLTFEKVKSETAKGQQKVCHILLFFLLKSEEIFLERFCGLALKKCCGVKLITILEILGCIMASSLIAVEFPRMVNPPLFLEKVSRERDNPVYFRRFCQFFR